MLEEVVKEKLEQYFESRKIYSKYQSGISKKFSYKMAVNYLINRWKKTKKADKIDNITTEIKKIRP